jgi:hypothetical protein
MDKIRKRSAAGEGSRQGYNEKEAREREVPRKEADQREGGAQPKQLSRSRGVGAGTVKPSDTGVTVKEPIQGWIESLRVKRGRGPSKGEMAK